MQKLLLSPDIHSYLVKVVCYFQDRLPQALVSFQKYMPPPLPYFLLFLSNLSEGGPVGIFKCGSRKEKYLESVTI